MNSEALKKLAEFLREDAMTEFEKRLKEHEERMRGMQENDEFNNDAAMIRLYTRHRESGGTLSPAEFRRMMVSQSRDLKKAAVEREFSYQRSWDPEALKRAFKPMGVDEITEVSMFIKRDMERLRKLWESEMMGKPPDEFEEVDGWKFPSQRPRKITIEDQIEHIHGVPGEEAPMSILLGGPSHGEHQRVGTSLPYFYAPSKIADYDQISHPDYNTCHGKPVYLKSKYFHCVFQAGEEGEEQSVYVFEQLNLEEALGLYAALVETTEEVICLNAREE